MKDVLFLHYGPGGNSQIEKLWFEEVATKIDFWDQPVNHLEDGSYKNLLEAAGEKLKDSVSKSGGSPVALLAHSFGCNLGLDLLELHPALVKKFVMLAPLSDLAGGFNHLAKRLASDPLTTLALAENLKKQIRKFEGAKDSAKLRIEAMWQLVGNIVQDPDFYRLYWTQNSAREKYSLHAKTAAAMDFTMWKNILNDYLKFHNPVTKGNPRAGCPVKIIIGAEDPYVEASREKEYWKQFFPKSDIVVLDKVGHYVHFEISLQDFLKLI